MPRVSAPSISRFAPLIRDATGLEMKTWLPFLESQKWGKVAGPRDSSLNHG
jgi:hypothetical protein